MTTDSDQRPPSRLTIYPDYQSLKALLGDGEAEIRLRKSVVAELVESVFLSKSVRASAEFQQALDKASEAALKIVSERVGEWRTVRDRSGWGSSTEFFLKQEVADEIRETAERYMTVHLEGAVQQALERVFNSESQQEYIERVVNNKVTRLINAQVDKKVQEKLAKIQAAALGD